MTQSFYNTNTFYEYVIYLINKYIMYIGL